eukprot:277398-Rhodomonas_salina.6
MSFYNVHREHPASMSERIPSLSRHEHCGINCNPVKLTNLDERLLPFDQLVPQYPTSVPGIA